MLSKLPRDILLQDILILLDSKSLINLSSVSTYFNYLVNDEHIWKRLCFQEFNISQDNAFRNTGWKQLYVALKVDTKVFTWGENRDDRLGLSPRNNNDNDTYQNAFHLRIRNPRRRFQGQVATPQEVVFLQNKGIIDIISGGWSFHALDTSGSVWMWGTMQQDLSPRQSKGTVRLVTPTKIQDSNQTQQKVSFRSISSGRGHVIGLARDGSIWHWSNHIMLQRVNLQLEEQDKVVQVVANWNYSSVLTNQGAIYIIPRPDLIISSQVSVEPAATEIVTPKVSFSNLLPSNDDDKIVQITGLDGYTIALTRYGRVLKLRTADAAVFTADPIQHVTELINFGASSREINDRDGQMKRFVTGAFDNFAIYTKDGQVLLGKVNAEKDTVPTRLEGLDNQDVCKVSFGDYHCGALTNQGKLLTWGNYSSGALGQGTDVEERAQPTPKVVESLNDMFAFAIGFGGWQSSVLAIPQYHTDPDNNDSSDNFIKVSE